jgi:DNA-binding NarL/FixJ family response regulator
MVQKSSTVRQREQIEWRQQKVLELTADGHTIREIKSILKMPLATVSRDIVTLRQQAKDDIHKYITDQVPY